MKRSRKNDSATELEQALKELALLRAENKELRALVAVLQEQNKLLVQALYGSSSEKAEKIIPEDNANHTESNEPEDEPDPDGTDADTRGTQPQIKAQGSGETGKSNNGNRRKSGGRHKLPKHLLRIMRVLGYDPECKACGHKLRIIGQHVVEKLAVIPTLFYVIQYVHKHTACPCCDDQISCAKAEPSLIPSSQATPELLAHLSISKISDGLPLYRQEKQSIRSECPIHRDKLNRWFISLGQSITPMVNLINDTYNSYDIGGIDSTVLQVIQEPGKTAYQLSHLFIRYGGPPNRPVMLSDYRPYKDQKTVDDLLLPFEGNGLVADMYAAFCAFVDKNPHIILYACHDHIRRKFVEALLVLPKQHRSGSMAWHIVELYKALYAIEKKAKGRSPRVIKKMRRRSRKILNKIYSRIESIQVRPKSKLGAAVTYALNNKPAAYTYLNNPLAPISNIMTEHVAKKIAVARKNFLFCFSVEGAKALANIMTLVYTAELYPRHNLFDYLTVVFSELPKISSIEDVEALLPWHLTPETVAEKIKQRPRPHISNLETKAA